MKNIAYAFLGLSLFVIAGATAAVKLDMKMNLDGKTSRPVIVTPFGQAAVLGQIDDKTKEGYEISATPFLVEKSEVGSKDAIKLHVVVTRIKGTQKTVIARSQVTTLVGGEAIITQISDAQHGEPLGGQKMSLSVMPTLE